MENKAPYHASLLLPHLWLPPGDAESLPRAVPTRLVDTSADALVERLACALESFVTGDPPDLFGASVATDVFGLDTRQTRAIIAAGRGRATPRERVQRCLELMLSGTPDLATLLVEPFDEEEHALGGYYDEHGRVVPGQKERYIDTVQPAVLPPDARPALAVYVHFSSARVVNYHPAFEALQESWVHRPPPIGNAPGAPNRPLSTAPDVDSPFAALAPLTTAGPARWSAPLSEEAAGHLLAKCWDATGPLFLSWTPDETVGHIEMLHWMGEATDEWRLDELRAELADENGLTDDGTPADNLSYEDLRDLSDGYFITKRELDQLLPRSLAQADAAKAAVPASCKTGTSEQRAAPAGRPSYAARLYEAAERASGLAMAVGERFTLPRGVADGWMPSFGLVWSDPSPGLCREMFDEAHTYEAQGGYHTPPELGLLLHLDDPEYEVRALAHFVASVRQAALATEELLRLIDPQATVPEWHAERLARALTSGPEDPGEANPSVASLQSWTPCPLSAETQWWHALLNEAVRQEPHTRRSRRGAPAPPPATPFECVPLLY